MSSSAYEQCLKKLNQKIALGVNRSLDRVSQALERLGNPQNSFQSIHIAGTNGKGSTCAMTAAILQAAGYRTGLTVSPHILSVRERLQINASPIAENDFAAVYEEITGFCHDIPLTYFECLIVMAFHYFARMKVDIAVIETGLGGRLDATNTLSRPLAGGITNVSLDHQEFLGMTLEEILEEKMQIAKPGMNFWSGIEDPELSLRLKRHCGRVGAVFHRLDDYYKDGSGQDFFFKAASFTAPLNGVHQKRNAAFALGICLSLNESGSFQISEAHIRDGLKRVRWPGRLEILDGRPRVLLDGAHNAAGVECLAAFLEQQDLRLPIVFGCLDNRDIPLLLNQLLPWVKGEMALVAFNHEKSHGLRALKKQAELIQAKGKIRVEVLSLNKYSWHNLMRQWADEPTILVTGSLYMVAEVRRYILGGDE